MHLNTRGLSVTFWRHCCLHLKSTLRAIVRRRLSRLYLRNSSDKQYPCLKDGCFTGLCYTMLEVCASFSSLMWAKQWIYACNIFPSKLRKTIALKLTQLSLHGAIFGKWMCLGFQLFNDILKKSFPQISIGLSYMLGILQRNESRIMLTMCISYAAWGM